jgi:hypothetical protein
MLEVLDAGEFVAGRIDRVECDQFARKFDGIDRHDSKTNRGVNDSTICFFARPKWLASVAKFARSISLER